jgi:hypothetical protein
MASPIHHALLAFALAGSLFAACGGKTAGENGGTSSSSGSSGGSGGSSGGSASGSSSGGTTGSSSGFSGTSSGGPSSSSGPPACVYIDPTTFDQSCKSPSDCFVISTGKICTGACLCGGNAAINVGGESRYLAEVNSIATDLCPCPPTLAPACSGNRCVACTGAPSDPPECFGPPPIDAGVLYCKQGPSGGSSSGGDAGVCSLKTTESCSDGTTYNVACSCPDAVCTCNLSSAHGGSSSGGFPFKGCAAGCDPSTLTLAYDACGFPLPQ